MAEIVKGKNNKNVSPLFLSLEQKINKYKRFAVIISLIVFTNYMILTPILVLGFQQVDIRATVLLIVIILSLLLKITDNHLENFNSLQSYQEYFEKSQNKNWKAKGDRGEYSFTEVALKELKDDNYKIINNIYIPGSHKHPQQVDTIIISPSSNIYVIEIKNWYGLISGQIKDEKWYTKNGYLQNPYLQNKKHVNNLKQQLSYDSPQLNIYNLVINMDPNSYLNICKEYKSNTDIFDNSKELINWIKETEKSASQIITDIQQDIISKILNLHFKTLEAHDLKVNKELIERYNILRKYQLDPA